MKSLTMAVLVVSTLVGCKSKAANPSPPPTNSDVPQAVRAGHRVDLGLDSHHASQLSDRDLAELRAQLHSETMSNIAAMKLVRDLQEAEDAARLEAGLLEAPLTSEQRITRLAAVRKALDEVRSREVAETAKKAEGK